MVPAAGLSAASAGILRIHESLIRTYHELLAEIEQSTRFQLHNFRIAVGSGGTARLMRRNGRPSLPEVYQKTVVRRGSSDLPSSQENQ